MSERFECTRCGKCCREEKVLVTSEEINSITDFLRKNNKEMPDFHKPFGFISLSKAMIVITHMLRKNGEGCIFYDAKAGGCKVYPARPYACRLFPFFVEEGRLLANRGCPGIGRGKEVDVEGIERLIESGRAAAQKDSATIRKFMEGFDLTHEQISLEEREISEADMRARKLTDPFVELGILG